MPVENPTFLAGFFESDPSFWKTVLDGFGVRDVTCVGRVLGHTDGSGWQGDDIRKAE